MSSVFDLQSQIIQKEGQVREINSALNFAQPSERDGLSIALQNTQREITTLSLDLFKLQNPQQNKEVIDAVRQESRLDITPTIVQQGQTTENQSWLPLLLIGLGFLVLAN